ncbi:hypothetical protein AMJ44_04530 [candidate division WOR-1 bacterium DG_54_3]|uniref:ResB-like domain-containing protein n=1 Tax=candidate division WOR-1 bacterium DG_54_3 TaxID=1703775 RepID=A0A0S7Y3G0_UNCSA|nr:MAG: hypothetical protein AMJ44_04530 [candidate division WOR-1 bacterium DG_54_3]
MWIFNSFFSKLFELIFFPFRSMSPWIGMIIISLLTGFLMLLVFRFTSNQEGIRKVKNKIKAHLLEFRLFKDSLSISLKAQRNILRHNLKYLSYYGKPMLIMIIPFILIVTQLNVWFGYQALEPGETTILKVELEESVNLLNIDLTIEPSTGFEIETPPLRIKEEGEINWRLRAKEKGLHDLTIAANNQRFTKKVAVAEKPLSKISPLKVRRNFINELLNPGELPLSGDLPIKAVGVIYPAKNMNLFGWHIHWLIVYIVLSAILSFAFRGIFKVEI